MPSRLATPVLVVNAAQMHTVDTRNVENLFSMWTVFSKCADSMEEGRRLENLSWRIWNRETFCCNPETQATAPELSISGPIGVTRSTKELPELSTSVDSVSSDGTTCMTNGRVGPGSRPLDIASRCAPKPTSDVHLESRSRGHEKHITSLELEKMVYTIKEQKELQPLAPLPLFEAASPSLPVPVASESYGMDEPEVPLSPTTTDSIRSTDTGSRVEIESQSSSKSPTASQAVGSNSSAQFILSSHSIIRGFSPGQGSSSYRSQARLAPTPIPTATSVHKVSPTRKKSNVFMLGGSSGEDEDSLDEHMKIPILRSSLTDGLKQSLQKKQTSFKEEVDSRTINNNRSPSDEGVFDSDDEEEEEDEDDDGVSESAIEDDDDSSDWEDSPGESDRSSVDETQMFQRVDSKPNLVSRRSLLTNLLHQPQRAAALANAALQCTPAMQRSRTSSPNGPSTASPADGAAALRLDGSAITHSKPIIMTTSNTHPPALSPRTTRRNMLATELTESLRRHLLWERQQKNSTATAAALKRRHTAHDMANLQEFPGQVTTKEASKNNSWNHYFDHGLGEYHQKGW